MVFFVLFVYILIRFLYSPYRWNAFRIPFYRPHRTMIRASHRMEPFMHRMGPGPGCYGGPHRMGGHVHHGPGGRHF